MDEAFLVRTFFLGQTLAEDETLIAAQLLDVERRSSDQPPKNFVKKIGWYADATLNQLRHRSKPSDSTANEKPLKLEDFHWPWAVTAFGESVDEFAPDSILIEYVKLSYLLQGLTTEQRKSTTRLVDTHDVLHLRCQQFRDRGFEHWINIDRREEANALSKFDTVVAIQDDEAKLITEMIADLNPQSKVIVCGHIPNVPGSTKIELEKPVASNDSSTMTIGYLASTNASNIMAIEWFLQEVWKPLFELPANQKRLLLKIGGTICQPLKQLIDDQAIANVELLGRIEYLASFYNSVDLAINPVEFGTGLKIKTVEAIGFGKPILATQQGVVGLHNLNLEVDHKSDNSGVPAVNVCETADEFRSELLLLVGNEKELNQRTVAAQQLAQSLFSDHQVYSSLKQCLLDGMHR